MDRFIALLTSQPVWHALGKQVLKCQNTFERDISFMLSENIAWMHVEVHVSNTDQACSENSKVKIWAVLRYRKKSLYLW